MTITVHENGMLHYFKLTPKTEINEFFENVALLVKCSDVQVGADMGLWSIEE